MVNHEGAVECRGCYPWAGQCPECKGSGLTWSNKEQKNVQCHRCGGTGNCPGCRGSGWIVIPSR